MKWPLLYFLLCEGLYLLCARVLLPHLSGELVSQEIIWTVFRLLSLAAMILLFRPQFASRYKIRAFSPWLAFWIGVALTVPVLVGDWALPPSAVHLFALTSIAVGFREEFAYRGILQTVLTEKFGFWNALLLSNIGFVFYHYGAQPLIPWMLYQLLVFGCFMGIVFYLTRSLVLVSLLHAAYDAIYCYTPLLDLPHSHAEGALVLGIALLGVMVLKWTAGTERNPIP